MTHAKISEIDTPADPASWLGRVERMARRPRFVAVALVFSAANAAAAISVLIWTAEPPRATVIPEVTVARLAPAKPAPLAEHVSAVALDNVVRTLPRAQTWHPPHMLPSKRPALTVRALPRVTPALALDTSIDGAPSVDPTPPEALIAALPRPPSPEPQPEVRLASLMPDSLAPAPLRPRMRPDLPAVVALVPDANGLHASLRPQARPKDLIVQDRRVADREIDEQPQIATLSALPREVKRPAAGGTTCNARLVRAIPNRKSGAKGGAAVMAGLMRVGGSDRDTRVSREILAGNTPSFLQDLVPVEVSGRAKDGAPTKIVFCVMPDYLAVGSDRDFVRVPLGLPAAMQIASRFEMMLPTRRMVDQIYRAADLQVAPQPMTPGPQMSSTDYLLRHNATVEKQVRGASSRSGALVSGHKKDLVMTNRLESNRGRVAIYGWHRSNGQAIQPLSTVHGATYADYSHGIRLVSQTAYLNGRAVNLADLFADPTYAGLISDEGPIRAAQLRLASAN
jgi:hypothetical protein